MGAPTRGGSMQFPRLLRYGAVAVVAVACTGVAISAPGIGEKVFDAGGTINACVGKSGALRSSLSAAECRRNQTPLAWSHVRAFRMLRATPDEVEITAVGSGPIGFPTDDAPPTEVLTLDLPQGVVRAQQPRSQARKAVGNGDHAVPGRVRRSSADLHSGIARHRSRTRDAGNARRRRVREHPR